MAKLSLARVCVAFGFVWMGCTADHPLLGPPAVPPPAQAVKIAFQVQPSVGVTDTPLTPAIQVAAVDSAGRPVQGDSVPITIVLGTNPGGAQLSGTLTVATRRGIAVFKDLQLNQAAEGYTLVAKAPTLLEATSVPLQVLPPRGTNLAFRSQPRQTLSGMLLPPVEVAIHDSAGRDMMQATTRVTIALDHPSGGITLKGTTTATASGGVVRFIDLSLSSQGIGLTLRASASGMASVSSDPFDVTPATTFKGSALAASAGSTCALDDAGLAWCWGDNLYGQLGEGRELSVPEPHPVSGGLTFSQISPTKEMWRSDAHSNPPVSIVCGITSSGITYCWGGGEEPFNGRDATTPQQVGAVLTTIGTGYMHACGLDLAGTAECWGIRSPGGGRAPTDKPFTQLATGSFHSCALTGDGAAFCWGVDAGGFYLGNGLTTGSATPVPVSGGHTFRAITASDAHTCGIDSEGVAWCWGSRASGALGDSAAPGGDLALVPVRVSGPQRFVSISAGGVRTCALDADRQAWCWGGETGFQRSTPVRVADGQTFALISVGAAHICALDATGEAWCWGYNGDGQLGNGQWTNSDVPVRVLGNDRFVSISAGGDVTCAVTSSGAGRCWGDNYAGELGDGHPMFRSVPGPVLGNHSFASLSGGGYGMCGLTANHETWCWGSISNMHTHSTPVRLAGDPLFRVLGFGGWNWPVASGCGIDLNGAGWCWGWGGGVLGNGSSGTSDTPVRISGGLTLSAISAGDHACGLTTGGDAYCWGRRPALPAGTDFSVPVLVGGGLKFVALSGGWDHDCALTASGDAYCWGQNQEGALGDGTHTDSPTPRLVTGGLHFATISTSVSLTCGVTTDGQAYCWRPDPNNLGYARPTLVPGGIRFVTVDVGHGYGAHACGIATNGAVYCWGGNSVGELGNGATSDASDTPTLVVGGLAAGTKRLSP